MAGLIRSRSWTTGFNARMCNMCDGVYSKAGIGALIVPRPGVVIRMLTYITPGFPSAEFTRMCEA